MEEKNLRSPKQGNFENYWNLYVKDIASRQDFQDAHLKHLELLCDCLVRYDEVSKIISEEGYVFESNGRYGQQIRQRPEVAIQKDALAQINTYSKFLGLSLKKNEHGKPDDGGGEWSL